jgi:Fe/S biogenesis protein NfuA
MSAELPRVELTEAAQVKLRDVIANYPEPVAGLRLKVARRGPEGLDHVLTIVEEGAEPAGDSVVEVGGLKVFVEAENAAYLDGVSVDFSEKGPGVSGLEFHNPNPTWLDPLASRLQELFDTHINPQIAAHGGYVSLLDVQDKTAYIEMGGGCQGCGMASVTLKEGIEVAIREEIPEIEEIVDTTDHASGTNPFYTPSKEGAGAAK